MPAENKRLQMMGTECAETKCLSLGLGDLPEACIAFILCLTTPRDVARLACVSTTFRAAANSDLVWETKLPPAYADILAQASKPPPRTSSKKEIYEFLCSRVFFGVARDYWLDRATGGICQSFGATELCFIRPHDSIWTWEHLRRSRFNEVAHLRSEWCSYVSKRVICFLHPGTYTLSWRMIRPNYELEAVQMGFDATGNDKVETLYHLTPQDARLRTGKRPHGQEESRRCRWNDDPWMELDSGEFTVESKDYPVVINCYLKEFGLNGGLRSGGLYLDGLVIRPSNLIPSLNWKATMNRHGHSRRTRKSK